MKKDPLPPTTERVERSTKPGINERIRRKTLENVVRYSGMGGAELDSRLRKLEREWDTERTLETSAAFFVLLFTTMGFLGRRKWFLMSGLVGAFLLQHALQGWCPPLAVIRRLGVRTADEIEKEKTMLKVLREPFGAAPLEGGRGA
jgi:hypothetical protein